ncbi:MAG: DNA translocase FtsK [Lachnospiraceae bacterium]|nr:DNA translocase FtsK [Lachnospiraceae bacterium]
MANSTRKSSGQGGSRSGAKRRPVEPSPIVRETETHSSEILLLILGALVVFLFLCNFGICGTIGDALRFAMFGLFGLPAYLAPPLIFLAAAFAYANRESRSARIKIGAGIAAFLLTGMVCELFAGRIGGMNGYSFSEIFVSCGEQRNGGGVIAGSLAYAALQTLSIVGTVLILLVGFIICAVLLTGRSFLRDLKRGGRFVADRTSREMEDMRERSRRRRVENAQKRKELEEKRQLLLEQKEDEKLLRRDRKVGGVTLDTRIEREEETPEKERTDLFVPTGREVRDDVHEITVHRYDERDSLMPALPEEAAGGREEEEDPYAIRGNVREIVRDHTAFSEEKPPVPVEEPAAVRETSVRETLPKKPKPSFFEDEEEMPAEEPVPAAKPAVREKPRATAKAQAAAAPKKPQVYHFPPIDLLHEGKRTGGDSDSQLKETAGRLEEILKTFGVNARVTDISQGPTVTRYELQPEAGVKVSKILGLADDIKLNLAATDIRIEAPIPGKAAVGIEVPNKTNETVWFRDVVDTSDFKAFKSRLIFGAGKDLAGKPVIADIAKMPHVLIAGATGSGKSVCINTIIMSILYKATPDEVKLIMVDPKVVELSVYNGIPHLLIPVVTEPQKAAAALNWAVAEMTRRYNLFAESGVRDLAGYNAHVERIPENERTEGDGKLPQILVIVDELADLMMTCANDVEAAIVRLTQLARAAGIHLVIATQRPSVDVITGLIKANMPSRIAFAVTSNTDSRTILDMVGAERLLGKGDMLFFPQGYTRPARVQGAFVSDEEVADVVAFIKAQGYQSAESHRIEEELQNYESAGGNLGTGAAGGGSDRDAFFEEAARLVIGKDKASIGMLQRVFKVGFNRAARMMDQLCEAGVVSEDEGTKPRRVLMSEAEFDTWLQSGKGEE